MQSGCTDKSAVAYVGRGFAKRTLLSAARKARIKSKDASNSSKHQKFIVAAMTPPMLRRSAGGTLPNSDTLTSEAGLQQLTMFDDDLSGLCLSVCVSVCLSVCLCLSFNALQWCYLRHKHFIECLWLWYDNDSGVYFTLANSNSLIG